MSFVRFACRSAWHSRRKWEKKFNFAFFLAITLDRRTGCGLRTGNGRSDAETSSGLPSRKEAGVVPSSSSSSSVAVLLSGPMRDFSVRGKKFFLSSRQATFEQIPLCLCEIAVVAVVRNSLARRVSVKTSLSTRKISYCESSERRQTPTSGVVGSAE